MASGRADFITEVTSALAEAYSFRGGADASKPASPVAKDIYWATDTKILYLCVADGAWTGLDFATLVQGALTLYANLAGGAYQIKNIADPTAAQDAATKTYVDTADLLRLLLSGGTMSGAIAMGTNKITGLAAPTADADAARKVDVDTVTALLDDVTQAQPARALDTIYQNSTKIRVITVSMILDPGDAALLQVGSASPPATEAARVSSLNLAVNEELVIPMTAIILPNYYYRVASSASPSIMRWTEWDLH